MGRQVKTGWEHWISCTLLDYSQSLSSGMWTDRIELGENTWFIADYSECLSIGMWTHRTEMGENAWFNCTFADNSQCLFSGKWTLGENACCILAVFI